MLSARRPGNGNFASTDSSGFTVTLSGSSYSQATFGRPVAACVLRNRVALRYLEVGNASSQAGENPRRQLPSALQRERARKRWTQEQAAEAAGLHPRHYQKLEEGSVNVTIGTLERLSRGFGVDVRRLFEP